MSQARFLWKCIYWSPLAVFPAQYVDVRYITGTSMTPTLNPDTSPTRDLAVFESYSRVYKRGDIVHLRSPSDMSKGLVKRIVALPGDTVQTLPPYNMPIVTVPPGHVWVEGVFTFLLLFCLLIILPALKAMNGSILTAATTLDPSISLKSVPNLLACYGR
ncbi:peptidase S24/S26A/S26B/S26C [Flagelloscypha sp. PMI_526]|nr:peptidase S24/S26A/S26B/S26C [Flagelloscypha sp. PMI_526]